MHTQINTFQGIYKIKNIKLHQLRNRDFPQALGKLEIKFLSQRNKCSI